MPNGWTDPTLFTNNKVITNTTIDSVDLVFPLGWITEILGIEILNQTAIRGSVCVYAYRRNGEPSIAFVSGDLQDSGDGATGIILWQGKNYSEGFLTVNIYGAAINDLVYIVAQVRMRRR